MISAMFEDFLPETEVERTFMQSLGWDVERLWLHTFRNLLQQKWTPAAARILCLGHKYAEANCVRHEFETIQSLLHVSPLLDLNQQYGLYRLCVEIVSTMFYEQNFDPKKFEMPFELINETRIRPYLVLMTNILMTKGQRKYLRLEAKLKVAKIVGRQLSYNELRFLGEEALRVRDCEFDIDNFLQKAHPSSASRHGHGVVNQPFKTSKESKTPDQQEAELLQKLDQFDEEILQKRDKFLEDRGVHAEWKKFLKEEPSAGESLQDKEKINWHESLEDFPDPPQAQYTDKSDIAITNDRKFVELNDRFQELKDKHGLQSKESATALIRVTEHINESQLMPIDKYINQLVVVLRNFEVDVSEFQLRKVYGLTGKIQGSPQLLQAVEELQRIIFVRREKLLGFDMSMAVPLSRLLTIWQAMSNLEHGEAFFKWIIERVSENFDKTHIVHRQIESANRRFKLLKKTERSKQIATTQLPSRDYEEHDEFIAMLSVVAFDHLRNDKKMMAEQVLMEMIAYYSDCESDIARRVGEMLWLLMETPLREKDKFRKKLIEVSIAKAFDGHLRRRFDLHVARLIQLSPEKRKENVDHVTTCVKAVFDLEDKDAAEYELYSEGIIGTNAIVSVAKNWHMSLDELCSQLGAEDEDKSIQMKQLQEIEGLVRKGTFNKAKLRLSKLMLLLPTNGMLQRLLLIAKLYFDAERIDESEMALKLLISHMTKFYVNSANELIERLSEKHLADCHFEDAIRVLNLALEIPMQTKDDVNRFLIRRAFVAAMADDVFDAMALTYMAFSDIPEPYENRESDTEPLLLPPNK